MRAKVTPINRNPISTKQSFAPILRLYLSGHTPKTRAALANLTMLCQEYMPDHLRVQVINLLKTPQLGAGEHIHTVSELAPQLPVPMRDILQKLAQEECGFVGVDLSFGDGCGPE